MNFNEFKIQAFSLLTVNPELGTYFEGDMQLSKGEVRARFSKTGLVDTTKRWPKGLTLATSKTVYVPYVISALYSELYLKCLLNLQCILF